MRLSPASTHARAWPRRALLGRVVASCAVALTACGGATPDVDARSPAAQSAPAQQQGGQATPAAPSKACWSEGEIRDSLYLRYAPQFTLTALGSGCAFRVHAITAARPDEGRDSNAADVHFRTQLDAVFERGLSPRYLAVYDIGFEEARGECSRAPCVFDARGRLLREGVPAPEAKAAVDALLGHATPPIDTALTERVR